MRLKKNIQPLQNSLDTLVRLRPVSFEWKEPSDHAPAGTQVGLIAQEVEKVRPDWVGVDANGFKTLNPKGLEIMLVDGVKTLKLENEALKAESDDLRQRVRSLEAGRRPLVSGVGEGGIGLGLCAMAVAVVATRRKRLDQRT
ncbi:MAG: tail fiber domain-containing protein [Polyangiaceae bacterium]